VTESEQKRLDRELFEAATQGSVRRIAALLRSGANPNAVHPDEDNRTALHQASFCNQPVAAVTLLLRAGAKVNVREGCGWTPLHFAARGDGRKTAVLVACGADVNARDTSGSTPLHWAARSLASARLLLAHGADVNVKDCHGTLPLHLTTGSRRGRVAALMVAYGARIDARGAVLLGRVDTLEASLKKDPGMLDRPGRHGYRLLHIAVGARQAEVVRWLLRKGAKTDRKTDTSGTPLHDAAGLGHTEIARILLQNRANVNALGVARRTPLHEAVPHKGMMELLIENGARLNAVDAHGHTPLRVAAGHFCARDDASLEQVLAYWHHPTPSARTPDGRLLLNVLFKREQTLAATEALLKAHARAGSVPANLNVILRDATKRGAADVLQLLRKYAAREQKQEE
jgi:ankyrin